MRVQQTIRWYLTNLASNYCKLTSLYTTCIPTSLLHSMYSLVVREFATIASEYYIPGSNPIRFMTFNSN